MGNAYSERNNDHQNKGKHIQDRYYKKNKQLNKICDKLRNTKTNPQLKILSEKKCKVPKEIHLSMHLLLHPAASYIQPKTLA